MINLFLDLPKRKYLIGLLCVLMVFSALTAFHGAADELEFVMPDSVLRKGRIQFLIVWPKFNGIVYKDRNLYCGASGVAKMDVRVTDKLSREIKDVLLTLNCATGRGMVYNLPESTGHNLTIDAIDREGNLLFQGQKNSIPLKKGQMKDAGLIQMRAQQQPDTRHPPQSDQDRRFTNRFGMMFVWIPAGGFMMGSPETEPDRSNNEALHEVVVQQGFYLQITEVTQGQWKTIMGNNPSHFMNCGADCPVERVSWEDTQIFIQKLNQLEKTIYRLPTEAEWEYAARAGTTTPFSFGRCLPTDQANYDGIHPLQGCRRGQYRNQTLPVASFMPNNWGLYDMHGNVFEWCQNVYREANSEALETSSSTNTWEGYDRVIRGGSWKSFAHSCRAANRNNYAPSNRSFHVGFRLVREKLQPMSNSAPPPKGSL